jgi:hypothetical protein
MQGLPLAKPIRASFVQNRSSKFSFRACSTAVVHVSSVSTQCASFEAMCADCSCRRLGSLDSCNACWWRVWWTWMWKSLGTDGCVLSEYLQDGLHERAAKQNGICDCDGDPCQESTASKRDVPLPAGRKERQDSKVKWSPTVLAW